MALNFVYEQTTALHIAVESNAFSVAEYLLQETKMDPDVQDAISKVRLDWMVGTCLVD